MSRTVNLVLLAVLLTILGCYGVAVAPGYDSPYYYDSYGYYWPYSGSYYHHGYYRYGGYYNYGSYRYGGFHNPGGYHGGYYGWHR